MRDLEFHTHTTLESVYDSLRKIFIHCTHSTFQLQSKFHDSVPFRSANIYSTSTTRYKQTKFQDWNRWTENFHGSYPFPKTFKFQQPITCAPRDFSVTAKPDHKKCEGVRLVDRDGKERKRIDRQGMKGLYTLDSFHLPNNLPRISNSLKTQVYSGPMYDIKRKRARRRNRKVTVTNSHIQRTVSTYSRYMALESHSPS